MRPPRRSAACALRSAAAVAAALGAAPAIAPASALHAQSGPGTTGAQVLQLPAGARAAALSGAYSAMSGDSDVLFYNPAGAADLTAAASLSIQRHVEDVLLGSAAGAFRAGPLVVTAGAAFLGTSGIPEIEPDPDFGGQRGRETGRTVSAFESAVRLGVASTLAGPGIRVGAAVGFVASDLAGETRSAPIVDLGMQVARDRLAFGAALQNLGGSLSGTDAEPTRLPATARAGVAWRSDRAGGRGAVLATDLVWRVREGSAALAAGVEAGILPAAGQRYSAVGRVGYQAEGGDFIGPLFLGAGFGVDDLAIDYAFQNLERFGAVHRVGLRWSRGRR